MARSRTDLERRDRGTPPGGRPGPDGASGPNQTPTQRSMPPRRVWLTFLVILVANFLFVRVFRPGGDSPVKVPYTLFREQVTNRNVTRIYTRGESLTGRFAKPVTYPV